MLEALLNGRLGAVVGYSIAVFGSAVAQIARAVPWLALLLALELLRRVIP